MTWKALLHADPTEWLLEPENPSVRYYALRDLLDLPAEDPLVQAAKAAVMARGPVPSILARQGPGGHWGRPEDFYIRSKYHGTVWTYIILAELGADAQDAQVRQAGEFILTASQDRQSSGFAYKSSRLSGGDHDGIVPCLTGNMLFSLFRLGFQDDPRVQSGTQWMAQTLRCDDGDSTAPNGWPYDTREICWGNHSCHYGIIKALKAMAEIPSEERTLEVESAIQQGSEFLLKHRILMSSHHPEALAMPEWKRLSFPWMWNSDILEVLDILTRLGYRDERMLPAIHCLISRQDEQGRWCQEGKYQNRFLVRIEPNGRPSKWVTLYAMRILKRIDYH